MATGPSSPITLTGLTNGQQYSGVRMRARNGAGWGAWSGAQGGAFTPSAAIVYATPPTAPSTYTLPGTFTSVSTTAALETAWWSGTPTNIVIEDGIYERATALGGAGAAHKVYARNLLGAELRFGLNFGSNDAGTAGKSVQGVKFNVSDLAKGSLNNAIIETWGDGGKLSEIRDCSFHGNFVMWHGVMALSPHGTIAERCVADAFTRTGFWFSSNLQDLATVIARLWDLDATRIYDTPRGITDGKHEYALWVGHKVTEGVKRVRGIDTGWSCFWAGNIAVDTVWTDIIGDVSYTATFPGHGMYIEAQTHGLTFERFDFGPDLRGGVVSEWDHDENALLNGAVTLPAASIAINNGFFDTWPLSGTMYIGEWPNQQAVTYTGKTGAGSSWTFTGCAGGTGAMASGELVSMRPGGTAATDRNTWQDGRVRPNQTRFSGTYRDTLIAFNFDKGSRYPTVQRTKIDGAEVIIRDGSNTPQCVDAATSLLSHNNLDVSGSPGAILVQYGSFQ